MAAAPVISATSRAGSLGIAVKNASTLLEALVERGIAIEVTHRSKRWLYGLKDLAPLREEVAPPAARRRGVVAGDHQPNRPDPAIAAEDSCPGAAAPLLMDRPSLSPPARKAFEFRTLASGCRRRMGRYVRQRPFFERLAILRLLYRVNQTGIRDQNGVGARGACRNRGGGWHAHRISAIVRAGGSGHQLHNTSRPDARIRGGGPFPCRGGEG
jgi:hypothetical protein